MLEKVRRGCAQRHMPDAAYADNEIKRYVGACDNDEPNAKKRKKKHEKYFLKYPWQKYWHGISILCLIFSSENRHTL